MQALMTQNSEGMQIDELPEITDEIVEGTLMWNQRQLMDFFDENNIFVEIARKADERGWVGAISYNAGEDYIPARELLTRLEAEEFAFILAFEQLEAL